MRIPFERLAIGAGTLLLLTLWALAWPWSRDMVEQPAPAPYQNLRPPVAGTLPTHGESHLDREQLEEAFSVNPVPSSDAALVRGKRNYDVYCTPCHGSTGQGDGPVSAVFLPPPDLGSSFIQENSDAWLYGAIRHGVRLMPRYGSELLPRERWEIVHFLRTFEEE